MVEPTYRPVGAGADLCSVSAGWAGIVVWVPDESLTSVPSGDVAVTDALLTTVPESMSSCVIAYVTVQVVMPFGSSVVTGQVTVPTSGSSTLMWVSVTLPVFVTTRLYTMVEPATTPEGAPACFCRVTAGVGVIAVSMAFVAETGSPCGGFAETVAELATCPALTSASVSAYVAVQVVLVRGARSVTGQMTVPTRPSLTAMPWSVTLPVFETRNV